MSVGQTTRDQELAKQIHDHILERAKLFLHEVRREETKHNYQWLQKHLTTNVVTSIELKRTLVAKPSIRHTEKLSAACEPQNGRHVLFITGGKLNMYQISVAICRIILERPSQSHMITFEQFLSLSLVDLKRRGYNVDRILRLKAVEQRIAEEARQKQLALEQENIRQQEKLWNENKALPAYSEKEVEDHAMPGAFAPSPEASPPPVPQDKGRFSLGNFIKGKNNSTLR